MPVDLSEQERFRFAEQTTKFFFWLRGTPSARGAAISPEANSRRARPRKSGAGSCKLRKHREQRDGVEAGGSRAGDAARKHRAQDQRSMLSLDKAEAETGISQQVSLLLEAETGISRANIRETDQLLTQRCGSPSSTNQLFRARAKQLVTWSQIQHHAGRATKARRSMTDKIGDKGKKNAELRSLISSDKAEAETGISQQQVSRWRTRQAAKLLGVPEWTVRDDMRGNLAKGGGNFAPAAPPLKRQS